MSAPYPPDPSTYRIPSLPRRVVVGLLLALPALVFLAAIPYEILTRLQGLGVSTPLPATAVVAAGVIIAAFTAARHIAKPTRAFGPVTIAGALFGVAYLLFISQRASVSISTHDTTVTLAYGTVFLLLIVVPVLRVIAGAVTTLEDARRPGERLPFDYPA